MESGIFCLFTVVAPGHGTMPAHSRYFKMCGMNEPQSFGGSREMDMEEEGVRQC